MNHCASARLAPTILASLCALSFPAIGADMQNRADAPAIEAAATLWAEAYNRGDVDAIVGMYTEDARLLPDGSEPLVGLTAIRNFFQKLKDSSTPDTIRFSNFEFYGSDPVVTECSDIEILDHSGKLKVRGKQVLIRMKQNGRWKIHRDIWTNNGAVNAP